MNRFLLALAALSAAAVPALAENVPMTADRWDVVGEAKFVERDGRQAIHIGPGPDLPLKGGQATVRGSDFSTGRIEYDMLVDAGRDFAGPIFRVTEDGNGEFHYVRPHMNGNPDSNQYTPLTFGNLGWQIFHGEGFESQVRFDYSRWLRVRVDVYEDSAQISVDGAPVLTVPQLKGVNRTGQLGFTGAGSAYFANLVVTPIANYRDPRPAAAPAPLPPGSIAAWQVSPPMPEAQAFERAAQRNWSGIEWRRIAAETNGIGNLTLAGPDSEAGHSYIARFTLRSAAARTAQMRFGYSDQVRIFLNGRPVYAGADLQGSRDYRFLGIVGLWDTLFLPLESGANEVTFVVTDETNGGTAAMARIEPDPAVTIEP